MDIKFYDVKNRKTVMVPSSDVKKVKYELTTKNGKHQVRYALKAVLNGVKLTTFVKKDVWDSIDAPMM